MPDRPTEYLGTSPGHTTPLPGSARMRRNARQRIAEWIDGDAWRVTGGDTPHVVEAGIFGKPETFTCDCRVSRQRPDHLCSHILAVMREM